MFAPRGCAILYVSPKFHEIVMPRVVSRDHDRSLQDRFFQQGTLDDTPYISSTSAIKFYLELGGMVSIMIIIIQNNPISQSHNRRETHQIVFCTCSVMVLLTLLLGGVLNDVAVVVWLNFVSGQLLGTSTGRKISFYAISSFCVLR